MKELLFSSYDRNSGNASVRSFVLFKFSKSSLDAQTLDRSLK